jgi:hypothetical protein
MHPLLKQEPKEELDYRDGPRMIRKVTVKAVQVTTPMEKRIPPHVHARK